MQPKRTLTMNFDGLGDDDDDDRFFESFEQRVSCAVPSDLASSSDDEEHFEESRMSFASAVSSVKPEEVKHFPAASMTPDYNFWMATPGSIKERRKRLLRGMGLMSKKEIVRISTSKDFNWEACNNVDFEKNVSESLETDGTSKTEPPKQETSNTRSPLPNGLVRSRSEGDIDSFSHCKRRKEELIGEISKQRLTRTNSLISAPCCRICTNTDSVRISPKDNFGRSIRSGAALTSVLSNNRFGAFFLIKNLDTGKEFIVNEYDEAGMWNRFSDLQTGKQLTVEEFEKCVGHSPVVKELMRRVDGHGNERKVNANSYLSKSLRMSKRRGAALLKNIKGSMSGLIGEKEANQAVTEQKPSNNSSPSPSSEWMKVRQTGKSSKELSALHLCQEIQAHEGSIWTIKFSCDARFLASAGEDRIIHVWEVQECEIMSLKQNEDGNVASFHPPALGEVKKKAKGSASRKGNVIPDYVHVPKTVFSLSEKPICSLKGHLDDVLDLSWSKSQLLLSSSMDKTVRLWDLESKSCLKMFAHNDYVTCIQFNPVDDDYFISGSLDAKVRIWSIPNRHVVDWTDLHEMVTAACYNPDGQGAIIGSHKGSCRMYSTEDCRLDQTSHIDVLNKKKSHARKITGYQFNPGNPSEMLVTSADSRIRILDGLDIVHKFRGFRNTSSQIAASFSQDGKYVICASEDSQVYVWKRDAPRNPAFGKSKAMINTTAHEHFHCRDVSVAIPWPGTVKGDPPPFTINSRRNSKRVTNSQPHSASSSPTRDDDISSAANNRRLLPPLPKKNNNVLESNPTPPEEHLAQVSHTDAGIGESFNSGSASIRYGDSSPSISAAANPSSASWSSSWSWFDSGNNQGGNHTVQTTAWGLVIVTAGLGGEIRAYQNFGLPRRIRGQTNFWTTA